MLEKKSPMARNEENYSFRFLGQYEDSKTGLYYNRFRHYIPDKGIYTQRDPIDEVMRGDSN